MSKKGDLKLFEDDSLFRTAKQCATVIEKWGELGKFTDKGINEFGLELISDFARALNCRVSITFVEADLLSKKTKKHISKTRNIDLKSPKNKKAKKTKAG